MTFSGLPGDGEAVAVGEVVGLRVGVGETVVVGIAEGDAVGEALELTDVPGELQPVSRSPTAIAHPSGRRTPGWQG